MCNSGFTVPVDSCQILDVFSVIELRVFISMKSEHVISGPVSRCHRRFNRMDLLMVTWLMERIGGLYIRWDSGFEISLRSGAAKSLFAETCKRSMSAKTNRDQKMGGDQSQPQPGQSQADPPPIQSIEKQTNKSEPPKNTTNYGQSIKDPQPNKYGESQPDGKN